MKKLLSVVLLSALFAQGAGATFPDEASEEKFRRFASRYELDLEPSSEEMKYGVPAIYFDATRALYSYVRRQGQFQFLEYLFHIMPVEHREEAFSHFNAFCVRPPFPTFGEFPGLKERLLGMPFEPNLPFEIE